MVTIVILRYQFNIGSIALQESITYLHSTLFMLAAAYTLQQDRHVRVDIFYQKFSTRNKAIVDIVGTFIFLFPVCIFLIDQSWDYVALAWKIREASGEAGGLAYVYLLKANIIAMPVLLMLQGICMIEKNLTQINPEEYHA